MKDIVPKAELVPVRITVALKVQGLKIENITINTYNNCKDIIATVKDWA
jgi:hypothetical protein